MLKLVKYDCRTVTGSNLRYMMIVAGKSSVDELNKESFQSHLYKEVPTNEEWRVRFAKEMMEILNGESNQDVLNWKEIEEILHHVVAS